MPSPSTFYALLTLMTLLTVGSMPTAVADDCTRLTPENGTAGVYSCPGGIIEVRSSGTLLATGPSSGVGWFLTTGDGSVYVAADFTCWGDWCYVSVAALPAAACQLRYNTGTHQVVTCPV